MVRAVRALAAALAVASAAAARAGAASFATVFSDDMVLQRGPARAKVFGLLGDDGALPRVRIVDSEGRDAGVVVQARKALEGQWSVTLPASDPAGGGNFAVELLAAEGKEVLDKIERVTFGDVWYCSGQSNMALLVKYTMNREEVPKILGQPGWDDRVRTLDFAGMDDLSYASKEVLYVRDDKLPRSKKWHNATALLQDDRYSGFSATCLYFGIQLSTRLAEQGAAPAPLGLVHASIGGTQIEAWVDSATLDADCTDTLLHSGGKTRVEDETLYGGLVAPFINMTLSGWVWYQGENNMRGTMGSLEAKTGYACSLGSLIRKWRRDWSAEAGTTAPDAPFGIVSLAPGGSEGQMHKMPHMRKAQEAVRSLGNVFVAQTYDLADPWWQGACHKSGCCPKTGGPGFEPPSQCAAERPAWRHKLDGDWYHSVAPFYMGPIHPRVKRRIGDRLALGAVDVAYAGRGPGLRAPTIASCAVRGTQLELTFNLNGGALEVVPFSERGVPAIAIEVCSGNKTPCECPYWLYKRVGKGTTWFCAGEDAAAAEEEGEKETTAVEQEQVSIATFEVPLPGGLGWRPSSNPNLKQWRHATNARASEDGTKVLADVGAEQVRAVRFGWEDTPCCVGPALENGTAPCPLLNCGILSKPNELPAESFFATVDPDTGDCRVTIG